LVRKQGTNEDDRALSGLLDFASLYWISYQSRRQVAMNMTIGDLAAGG
jgi:hypothetical protein